MGLGISTFAETPDPRTQRAVSLAERLRDLVEEIELADQIGLDVFGVASPTVRSSPSGRRPSSVTATD